MGEGCIAWISSGGIADPYVVFARTGEAPGAKGLSAFIVNGDNPGLSIAERIEVIAPHPLARARLRQPAVSAADPIGKRGDGFKIAMATLDVFRTTVGAAALGFARRALARNAQARRVPQLFGAPLGDLQMVQGHLADMSARDRRRGASRLSRRLDQGRRARRASRAKPRWQSSTPPKRRSA